MPDLEVILERFKKHLLSSAVRDSIGKIILVGSHAKGTAVPDSDIDILLVLTDGLEAEKSVLNEVYEFMTEQRASLEVVTSSVTEFFFSPDYFLRNISHYGREVYSMSEEELKLAAVRELKGLAEEYLESAEEVLDRGRLRLAIDAAYNACELAAKGLILLKQDDLPGSHGGVVSSFGQLYVKTGEVEKQIGRDLNLALKLRNEARYKPGALLRRENAVELLSLARRLLEFIEEKMRSGGNP